MVVGVKADLCHARLRRVARSTTLIQTLSNELTSLHSSLYLPLRWSVSGVQTAAHVVEHSDTFRAARAQAGKQLEPGLSCVHPHTLMSSPMKAAQTLRDAGLRRQTHTHTHTNTHESVQLSLLGHCIDFHSLCTHWPELLKVMMPSQTDHLKPYHSTLMREPDRLGLEPRSQKVNPESTSMKLKLQNFKNTKYKSETLKPKKPGQLTTRETESPEYDWVGDMTDVCRPVH